MTKARDDEAREVAEHAGGSSGDDEAGERLAPTPLRDQSGGVGGKAEIGGVAERDDTGITEDEIERERKQRGDRDLAREHEIIGREHEGEQRREPERDLERAPAHLRLEIFLRLGWRDAHRPACVCSFRDSAAYTVCSPPPCGEGLGVGVRIAWRGSCGQQLPPSPSLPQPAAGLPASGKIKLDRTPA